MSALLIVLAVTALMNGLAFWKPDLILLAAAGVCLIILGGMLWSYSWAIAVVIIMAGVYIAFIKYTRVKRGKNG